MKRGGDFMEPVEGDGPKRMSAEIERLIRLVLDIQDQGFVPTEAQLASFEEIQDRIATESVRGTGCKDGAGKAFARVRSVRPIASHSSKFSDSPKHDTK